MKLYNLNTYIYIFLKILLIINDISNLIQIREKQIIKQIILSTNSIFFFKNFTKLHEKTTNYRCFPISTCSHLSSATFQQKKKKVAADTIASTLRRENNLFRNTYTRRSFMQDARTREKDSVANTKVQRNVSHLQS